MLRLTILIVFFTGHLFAQDGTRVYEFLNLTQSPRQAALGGAAQSAWDSDPNMAMYNPALMNVKSHGQMGANYVNYLTDISVGSASFVYTPDEENFFALHGQFVDYGDFDGFDEFSQPTGSFSAQDAAIYLGYARNLGDFFTVGANLKFITSKIEQYNSNAVAADIGVVFHDIDYRTNYALIFRNIGAQITPYNQTKEDLPFQVNFGISHTLEHVPLEVTLTLQDLQKFDLSEPVADNGQETGFGRKIIDHISLGAELFPQKGFNLRVGYNFRRGNELSVEDVRSFSGLTYGFGIRINAFRFEYAHANYHKSGGTNHFGLIINLDRLISGYDYWKR